MKEAIARTPADYETFRIKPSDTNVMSLILDPIRDKMPFIAFVEIFDKNGATPPNTHEAAYEFFYVIEGEGVARIGGKEIPIKSGDSFVANPGHEHIVENTGEGKLYCLTLMIPNEGFAELVRSGGREALSSEDLAVLQRAIPTKRQIAAE
jgi:mannose-6-phosphate isomerase-like protein (cupin superfamily)